MRHPNWMRAAARVALAVAIVLSVGALACGPAEDAGTGDVTPISAETLLASPPANALVLDVRTRDEFAAGHVPGATNIPHDELEGRLAELGDAQSRPVVVYCESGRRAGKAEATLLAAGFSDLRHLEGDMKAWRAAGRPTER